MVCTIDFSLIEYLIKRKKIYVHIFLCHNFIITQIYFENSKEKVVDPNESAWSIWAYYKKEKPGICVVVAF